MARKYGKGPPKTLLINPLIGSSPPFGLLYIAATLEKHGYPVEVEELNTYGHTSFNFDSLIQKIVKEGYDVIGITCLTSYSEVVKVLIKGIRQNCPSTKIVVGGPHATALPEEVLKMGADVAVIGEGESTFLQVVDNLSNDRPLDSISSLAINQKLNGDVRPLRTALRSKYEDLNKIPYPAYHLINLDRYISNNYAIRGFWLRCGWVFTSRGCPGACTFCASYITHGYKIRERELEGVIEELELLKKKYGLEAFWILDDTFTIREERVVRFCEKLREKKLDFIWACQARVDFFTDRMAKTLKNSGCVQVDFGVESGSQKVLNALKKGIKVEETRRAFANAHNNGLRALATVMLGNPTETWEDIYKTKELLDEIKPDYTGVFFTTPYPGTKLYEEAITNRWIDVENLKWSTEGHNADPIMFINFDKKELDKIYSFLVSDSFAKTILGYLKQRKFIFDLLGMIAFHPLITLELLRLLITGQRKEFVNSFRRFRICGSL